MIKQRNIGICILLSIVTCGIYGLYWFVVLTRRYQSGVRRDRCNKWRNVAFAHHRYM